MQHQQSSEPDIDSGNTGNSSLNPNLSENVDSIVFFYLDVPIALRKCVRSCTSHPISKFVSYHRLSPSYRAFATNLSSCVSIPSTVQEAVTKAGWKKAIHEEISVVKGERRTETQRGPGA